MDPPPTSDTTLSLHSLSPLPGWAAVAAVTVMVLGKVCCCICVACWRGCMDADPLLMVMTLVVLPPVCAPVPCNDAPCNVTTDAPPPPPLPCCCWRTCALMVPGWRPKPRKKKSVWINFNVLGWVFYQLSLWLHCIVFHGYLFIQYGAVLYTR